MEVQLLTDGVEGTLALGAIIAASSPLPLIVKLSGQLGGGKTHLVKGLAQALCGTSPMHVTSPTFTLLHSYRGRGATLHHLDLYRVESAEEAPDEILDALEDMQAWVAVEWADRHPSIFPKRASIEVEASHGGEEERVFRIIGSEEIVQAMVDATSNAEGVKPSA